MRELTASKITEIAMNLLIIQGFEVWRQNNLAVKGRKFIGKKGIADITGIYKGSGKRMECEVKASGDTLSQHQIEFLLMVHQNGGYAFIAHQVGNEVVISKFVEYASKEIEKFKMNNKGKL